jgi:hypothetical protein
LEVGLNDILIDAETASRHIGLKPGSHLCLRVEDNGQGTLVTIYLPRVVGHPAPAREVENQPSKGTGSASAVRSRCCSKSVPP